MLADKIRRHVRQHGCFWRSICSLQCQTFGTTWKLCFFGFDHCYLYLGCFFFSSSSHKVAASVVQFASSFGTMIVAVHLKLLILAPCPRLFLAFCKACEELTTPLVAPIAECYLMLDRGISSSKLRLLSISHLFDPFFLESLKVQPSKEWTQSSMIWLWMAILESQNPTKHDKFQVSALASDKLQRETLINP